MLKTLGSENSGFMEEELEDFMPDWLFVKWPPSGWGLETLVALSQDTRLQSWDGDYLLENHTIFL